MPVIFQNAAEGHMVVHQMNYFSFYTFWASVIYRNIGMEKQLISELQKF